MELNARNYVNRDSICLSQWRHFVRYVGKENVPAMDCSTRIRPVLAHCPFVLVDIPSTAYLDPSLESK